MKKILLFVLVALSARTVLVAAQHTIDYLTYWTNPSDPITLVHGAATQYERERNREGLNRALNSHLLADGDTVVFTGSTSIQIHGQIDVQNKDNITLAGNDTLLLQFDETSNTLVLGESCSGWDVSGFTFFTHLMINYTGNNVLPENPLTRPLNRGSLLRVLGNNMYIHDNSFIGAYEFGVLIGADIPSTSTSGDNVYVYDNYIAFSIGDGVHMIRGRDTWIASNTFDHTGDDTIGIFSIDGDVPQDTYVFFNTIYAAGNRAVAVGAEPGVTSSTPASIHTGYNNIYGTRGTSIEYLSPAGANNEIISNVIEDAGLYTMLSANPSYYDVGQTHSRGDAWGHGIHVQNSAQAFTISGNTLTRVSLHGIFENGGTTFSNLATGNSVSSWLQEDPASSYWSAVPSGQGPNSIGTAAVIEW